MPIKTSKSGFCFGVQNAVDKARAQQKNIAAGKQIYLYGDLVNNKHVIKDFLNNGYIISEDIDSFLPDSIVIIRAHGAPANVYEKLKAKNITIIDCTCVNVKKIHDIVSQKSANGYKIIIIGKSNHPEVIGTAGWCSGNLVFTAENEDDLNKIDLSGKVNVVTQTTFNRENWEKLTAIIQKKNASAEIEKTLCSVTKDREEEAKKIAGSSDVMLVIGDADSSNSRELYRQCRSVCKNTFSIHSLEKKYNDSPQGASNENNLFVNSLLDLEANENTNKILLNSAVTGLAASASTPDDIINDVYNYLQFLDFFKIAKKEIEIASNSYFDEFNQNITDNIFIKNALESLREQNEGGKRVRGAMIKLGEKIASRGKNENYLPVAVGYELFQTSVLIHDDIVDKSESRRKKTTIHVDSAKKISGKTDGKNAEHFGTSRAICIGDYGFFISYQFLAKCKVDSLVLNKIYNFYSQILTKTCEGELLDVILPVEKISIYDNYKEYQESVALINEFKTAWYTLAGPIMLGAICGGASEELLTLLKNIAIPLGIAFQIKDDLLGIYASEKVLGKPVISDIKENKQTLMYGFAYKNANEQQRALLDRHYGKEDADENDLQIVQKLFMETGAKKYAEDEIRRLSNQSKELINTDLIDKDYQSVLYGLISYQIARQF